MNEIWAFIFQKKFCEIKIKTGWDGNDESMGDWLAKNEKFIKLLNMLCMKPFLFC